VIDPLSITGLWLVNRDIMQLNIVIGEPQLESGFAYTQCVIITGTPSCTNCIKHCWGKINYTVSQKKFPPFNCL